MTLFDTRSLEVYIKRTERTADWLFNEATRTYSILRYSGKDDRDIIHMNLLKMRDELYEIREKVSTLKFLLERENKYWDREIKIGE